MDKEQIKSEYEQAKSKGLRLDMSRGKPCGKVTALSNEMFALVDGDNCFTENGVDCRNYGIVDGIPEAKRLFSQILGVSPEEVIIGNNSSLSMMYDCIVRAMVIGVSDNSAPWIARDRVSEKIKFLCPVPGYDRHFSICESLGIEMLPIPELVKSENSGNSDGMDMDKIEELVANDADIKGMWCVPIYSNPTGRTYSDETVRRFARMKTKADNFRIFWDCAYIVHHLSDRHDCLLNILEECKKAGNPERVYMFASTSKITFPGGGVAIMAASRKNVAFIRKHLSFRTVGSDKINQLRHVRFLKDYDNLQRHMKLIQEILRPKFDTVVQILERELKPHGLGSWNVPNGGYFISFDGNPGTAKETVRLCKEAGLTLTKAGATFPYGNDPDDKNIRIAPTLPTVNELKEAMNVFCLSVKLANIGD